MTTEQLSARRAAMGELAQTLRGIADNIDPSNHMYGQPDCAPLPELSDYERQAREAVHVARGALMLSEHGDGNSGPR